LKGGISTGNPFGMSFSKVTGLSHNDDIIVLLWKNYHPALRDEDFFHHKGHKAHKACPDAGQGKSTGVAFVFFVPFVVQFWLRL